MTRFSERRLLNRIASRGSDAILWLPEIPRDTHSLKQSGKEESGHLTKHHFIDRKQNSVVGKKLFSEQGHRSCELQQECLIRRKQGLHSRCHVFLTSILFAIGNSWALSIFRGACRLRALSCGASRNAPPAKYCLHSLSLGKPRKSILCY